MEQKKENQTTKRVIVNSVAKEGTIFVGLNGVGFQINCNEEVDLPIAVINILKNAIESKWVADHAQDGTIKGTKMTQEKRYIIEAV